jgi:hypothetical protein
MLVRSVHVAVDQELERRGGHPAAAACCGEHLPVGTTAAYNMVSRFVIATGIVFE